MYRLGKIQSRWFRVVQIAEVVGSIAVVVRLVGRTGVAVAGRRVVAGSLDAVVAVHSLAVVEADIRLVGRSLAAGRILLRHPSILKI